ncbi:MAG: glycosyltransferase [Candidatus Pacebacteria bacterium]|nr:glycosyltransferase [Candidatus Paceibacterota bacterium]
MLEEPVKKSILYIITKSNLGGAQKYVLELAEAAMKEGYHVSVACGGTGEAGAALGPLVSKLKNIGITVYPIDGFMRNMSLLNDIKAFFSVWRTIRKSKPDVLHVTSSKAGGIGALAGRLAFVPRIIFTSHGLTVDEVWRPRWQRILIYLSTWTTLRLAHKGIMISTETFNRARNMPGLSSRISLIMNGVSSINFIEKKEARKKLGPEIPNGALWIGGIGELHPNKNWSAAISAMQTLPKNTHLIIIGEGEERPKLESLILNLKLKSRVHLLGYMNGAQYLKALDIFILPSKKEGLPYVLLESGLARLATVASDLPGNRDIIKTGENGMLIDPTPTSIAASLSMLCNNKNLRQELGVSLEKTVLNKFSIEQMTTKTFNLYQ